MNNQKEDTLSDKIFEWALSRVVFVKDIKKSIEEIKDRIDSEDWEDGYDINPIIDSEMGDKLTCQK